MPKSWQHGRLRVVVLQVAMWVILGASLGLAAFIDHRKTAGLDVTLGEPSRFGPLVVRLPKGWELEREAGPPKAVVAKDYDRQGRLRRTLKITQERQNGRVLGPESYLENTVNLPEIEQIPDVEPFAFLGQDEGALVAFIIGDTRRGRRARPRLPQAGLYAATVLPDGLSVTVQLYGEGAYGPSSRHLVRLVADNLKLADGPSESRPQD
jgi:hypothetical protein